MSGELGSLLKRVVFRRLGYCGKISLWLQMFREKERCHMAVERVTPQDIFDKVQSGEVMLVCAYDSEDKFRQVHLEGAISLGEFKAKEDELGKNKEIVFYCA